MATNNFEQIKGLLNFQDKGDFYFAQIIQRRKENPGLARSEKIIKDYYFHSIEELEKKEAEIIKLCETFGARAYIAINKRNEEKIALMTLKIMADHIAAGQYGACKSAYTSACGQFSSDPEKKWIIDYDDKSIEGAEEMIRFISEIEPKGDKHIATIPTRNGFHIITRPFNKIEFAKRYNGDDIKKDNYTILYCI